MRHVRFPVALAGLALLLAACVPPIVVVPPTLVGTARVGEELRVTSGTWWFPGTLTFQWQRCGPQAANCVNVPGATSQTYVPVLADAGARLRAQVTNTNDFGTRHVNTAFTARIVPYTSRVSLGTDSTEGSYSLSAAISADGHYVAYSAGYMPGFVTTAPQIYVRDLVSEQTHLISRGPDGSPGNSAADWPSISADGRYVAFASFASNLVPDDTTSDWDVFVHDIVTETTTLVSGDLDGAAAGGVTPVISGDGRHVVFESNASNLVPGDTNGITDVFMRDLEAGTTTLVSVATDGTQADGTSYNPAVNHDGRHVAFESSASNLVPGQGDVGPVVLLRDTTARTTSLVSSAQDGSPVPGDWPWISGDGRFVTFGTGNNSLVPEDTNGREDIYLRDTVAGALSLVSVADDGSPADVGGYASRISADGRHVAFMSNSSDLVPGDTNGWVDVFVRDLDTNTTRRVSVATDGTETNHETLFFPSISADGRYVAFASFASNLVPDDTNQDWDIFVRVE